MNDLLIALAPEVRAELSRRAGAGAELEWVADAVRERLDACAAREFMVARGARGSREGFERVLAKAGNAPPMAGDE